VYANPVNACSTVQFPPPLTTPEVINFILVARRFDCLLEEKIRNAQNAGYTGIIIHNVGSNAIIPECVTEQYWDPSRPLPVYIYIDVCFIGEYYGGLLRDKFNYTSG